MKQIKLIACLLALLSSFAQSFGQTGETIKGKVSTSDGKAAEGVTVSIKALQKTVVTDDDGNFIIRQVKPGTYTLEAVLVGFQPVTQTVTTGTAGAKTIAIRLSVSEEELQEVIVTNGHNKFAKKESVNVARMPLRNLENAQSYTVVTKDLMNEQVAVDYRSATKNIPGTNATVAPNGATFIRMRGFYVGSYVRNGLAAQQYAGMDPINLERIEAIKGPSGTLFGSSLIAFGGLTNRVTKKPLDHVEGEISYAAGSWDLNRLTADVNAPLNKEKTVLMRMNGAFTSTGTFQDYGFEKSYAVAPSFLYKVNDKLTLLLDLEAYNVRRTAPAYPIIGAAVTIKNFKDLPLNYKYSLNSNDDMIRQKSQNTFVQASYKINDQWTSNTLFALSDTRWDTYSSVNLNWTTDSTIVRALSLQRPRVITSKNFQQNINGDFHIGRFRNRFLAGVDVYYTRTTTESYSAVNYSYDTLTGSRVIRPVSMERLNAAFATQTPTGSLFDQLQYAAYVSDVFNITDQLNVMVGLRADRFENRGTSTNGAARTGKYEQNALSPKLGLVYEVIKNQFSVFGNYSNGFQNLAPSTQPDQTVLTLKAQQANQWEAGFKTEAFSQRLVATVSYYNIKVSNSTRAETRTYTNSAGQQVTGSFTVQDGTQLSKGIDVDVIANPVAGLNIVAGYGYNDIKYIQAAANIKGKQGTMAPHHLANTWISYKFQSAGLKGLGLGVGGNYVAQSYWDNINTFIAPSYTTIDASAFYEKPTWRLALKINNLGNQKGWSINGDPIALRQIIGALSFRF